MCQKCSNNDEDLLHLEKCPQAFVSFRMTTRDGVIERSTVDLCLGHHQKLQGWKKMSNYVDSQDFVIWCQAV